MIDTIVQLISFKTVAMLTLSSLLFLFLGFLFAGFRGIKPKVVDTMFACGTLCVILVILMGMLMLALSWHGPCLRL